MGPWHGHPRLTAQQDTRRCTKDYSQELDFFRILLSIKQKRKGLNLPLPEAEYFWFVKTCTASSDANFIANLIQETRVMGIPLEPSAGASKPQRKQPALPKSGRRSSSRQSGRLATDSIGFYLSSIGRVPLLTPAEEIELAHHVQEMKQLKELPEDGRTPRQRHKIRMGQRARDRMMAANLRLVVSVAKKYQNQGLELLDLVQEGAIGLERAVDKFDPAMGYKFSTYALSLIHI